MDLPLSSNTSEANVEHWILNLSCDFEQRRCQGSVTLICKANLPLKIFTPHKAACAPSDIKETSNNQDSCTETYHSLNQTSSSMWLFVLDSHALDVKTCHLSNISSEDTNILQNSKPSNDSSHIDLRVPQSLMEKYMDIYKKAQRSVSDQSLDFISENHCIKIFIPICLISSQSPYFVVTIYYSTESEGPSLTWTRDQDLQPCLYTSGHLLNNRSLLPCQDLPHAMSTWHCFVTVNSENSSLMNLQDLKVLSTGQSKPDLSQTQDGSPVFGYSSSYLMPVSTFALAVGSWPAHPVHCYLCASNERQRTSPSLSVFCSHKLAAGSGLTRLCQYLPQCIDALEDILGSYPLRRLDVLVTPTGFDSMGMMSPHLLLLSQSVLLCDSDGSAQGSLLYRIAHELCHTWLGVLTGPKDWTEEWLTEGLCCYLEDLVHAKTSQWCEPQRGERLELRCLLKHRILKAEVSHVPQDLQTLRPNGENSNLESNNVVKNGLNTEKTFLQVHYLKGFFLLKHFESLAGQSELLQALRSFITKHLGQLFSSQDLLTHIFQELPKLSQCGLTIQQVGKEWLDSPELPKVVQEFTADPENRLYKQVQLEFSTIVTEGRRRGRKRSQGRRVPATTDSSGGTLGSTQNSTNLLPEQCVLLMDWLVDSDVKVTLSQMANLRRLLAVPAAGAEIQHSWCELVVRKNGLRWISDIEAFLTNHQAMGVYLYGELMISEQPRFQALAHKMFQSLGPDMSKAQYNAVKEMLYPT